MQKNVIEHHKQKNCSGIIRARSFKCLEVKKNSSSKFLATILYVPASVFARVCEKSHSLNKKVAYYVINTNVIKQALKCQECIGSISPHEGPSLNCTARGTRSGHEFSIHSLNIWAASCLNSFCASITISS